MGRSPVPSHGRFTPEVAMRLLARSKDAQFVVVLEHGSASVEIYKPHKIDPQVPHDQDEIYVILSGSGFFVHDGVRQPFEAGELLFVAAGVPHRFEDFTEDFATWAIFYGPEGGEK
ncbi:MAG TPA: cupin domain-containing protein [Thermoplasmata archaeon]|nr:cupin domain-containing protein [Thermoplasmata archaeon]